MNKKLPRELKSIKSGGISRGFALAKLSLKAGTVAASHALGSLLGDAQNKNSPQKKQERGEALLLSQVQLFSEALGDLKGSLMKVGQMLSMYGEHIFSPEVNAVLKTLQTKSPPLAWTTMEKVIHRRLTPKQRALIEISPLPLAAASLGQVHLATLKASGKQVALKVQYPGVEAAIESDLRAMRRFLSLSKFIPGGHEYDDLFNEVKQMLKREVDYTQEFASTLHFKKLLENDPRYVVPEPIAELSGKKILATSFEIGVAVDSPEVLALSQERRNALGIAIYELFLREIFEFRRVQTDAHFGNYQIRLNDQVSGLPDQIILFDFGAMRAVPISYLEGYRDLIKGALYRNREQLEKGALQMGLLNESDPEEAKNHFADLCYLVIEPASLSKDIAYDWGKSDLTIRAIAIGRKLAFAFKLRPPPKEAIFIERKTGGVFIFLKVLGAQFNPNSLLEKYLNLRE